MGRTTIPEESGRMTSTPMESSVIEEIYLLTKDTLNEMKEFLNQAEKQTLERLSRCNRAY